MLFNLFLKIVKAQSEADRLKWSVYYGWGLIAISIISLTFSSAFEELEVFEVASLFTTIFIISALLFTFRYTSVKPFLGAIGGGISVISITMIFESFFRRDNAASFGALIGVLFVLFFMIIKNLAVGLYYLIKETIRYVQYKKSNQTIELEVTD